MYILIWSILLYCSLFQSVAILNDFLFISIHSSQLELQQDWIVIKVHLWNKCSLCVYVRVYVCVCVCVPSAEGCLRPKSVTSETKGVGVYVIHVCLMCV